jgi:hypothetical protein
VQPEGLSNCGRLTGSLLQSIVEITTLTEQWSLDGKPPIVESTTGHATWPTLSNGRLTGSQDPENSS